MQVKIGDAPANRVVSFEVTIGPITLMPANGAAVTVLSGTRRIELTHLSGTSEMLSILKVPQGDYTSASITVANPEITFLDNTGTLQKIEPAFNQTLTISLNPPLTIGPTSSVLNFDLNVANALTFDAQGSVTGINLSSSSFNVSSSPVAPVGTQNNDNGELEDTTGVITAVNGSSFTLTVDQTGVALDFTTDTNTKFEDGATLALQAMVSVDGVTEPDGTLYAKKIEGVEDQHGAEGDGLITQVVGNPATQVTLVVDHAMGSGMDDSNVGSMVTADVSHAQYKVQEGDIDTNGIGGLPSSPDFPFDAATLHAGQSVEIDSDNSMNAGSLSAKKVELQQQALSGTVSGLTGPTTAGPVTFTLTIPADSAFAMLSGQSQVTVFWQQGTNLHNLASVKNGDSVRVRGLVFFTGSGFNMIAGRIDQ
jgi:hypothetical protein